jgi:hypothetical protein
MLGPGCLALAKGLNKKTKTTRDFMPCFRMLGTGTKVVGRTGIIIKPSVDPESFRDAKGYLKTYGL